MRKLLYVLAALSLLIVLVPVAAVSADQTSVDLIAGQSIDAGDVIVSNDGENLYVQFVAADGWCISETHVAVGTSVEEIPQTKKENPIPGKFLNSAVYSPCEETPEPYVIPLEWDCGANIYIAAHAVVGKAIEGCVETVWQIGDVETDACDGGLLTNYADEFNWGDPAGPCTAGPTLDVRPDYTTPFVVGTTPTGEFPYNSNYVRGYATDFDVHWDGELPFGGELIVSWSPGASASEKKVVSDGFPTWTLTAIGAPKPGEGWFLDTYPLVKDSNSVDPVASGTHTINFLHTQGDGTFWDWIRLERPCEQWETGWGEGTPFAGQNWAMYFTHEVQCEPACPSIIGYSSKVQPLDYLPTDIRVGQFESDDYVRIWQEFVGPLQANLAYDLEAGRSAWYDGPNPYPLSIAAGTPVCSYYVHLDNVGSSPALQKMGWVQFDADILGLIISGGNLGTFGERDLMFAADAAIGHPDTTYPGVTGVDYWRGFDVHHLVNTDNARFSGGRVDFTMYVVEAHDSFRVILPAVWQ